MALIGWATHVLQWLFTKRCNRVTWSESHKGSLSSDCRLQLALHEGGIVSNRGSARHGECFGALYTPPVTSGECDWLEVPNPYWYPLMKCAYLNNLVGSLVILLRKV